MSTSVDERATPRSTWPPARRAVTIASSVVAVGVAVLVAVGIGPQPMHLGFQTTGDAVLSAQVREILGADGSDESTAGYRSVAVATVDGGVTRSAGLGNRGDGQAPTNTTTYELGSITKLFSGLMLADAVDRGEVRLSDALGSYLPSLVGRPAGDVTLEELATHRSGLPAYADEVTGATYEGFGHSDVESVTEAVVLGQVAGLRLSGRGQFQYSNLGVSLLGYALAAATHSASWTELVTERVLKPAGMSHTTFAATRVQVPTTAAVGYQLNGRATDYSVGPGYFPAGTATFTTTDDLGAFASWILEGRAIGLAALQPRHALSATDAIGLVWMTTTDSSGVTTWHNGSVPGFTATLRLDSAHGRAVAVLGSTDASVEEIGMRLLDPELRISTGQPWVARGIALMALLALLGTVRAASRLTSLVAAGAVALVAQASLVLLLRFADWQQLPGWIWPAAAALVAATTVLGATRAARNRGAVSVAVVVGLVAAVVLYAVTVWVAG
ncbi:MAG: serine hydrolase domain-containing protein [Propionibacteriaceae bacterium]